MDPVSQGVLGGAVSRAAAPREARWAAAALGCLAGMAPDLDILVRSSSDPLLFLEYHRQFTHALVFIPFGALCCAVVGHAFVRRTLRFRATYLFCLLGYASHGLLDACTSYGTQLFWPLSDVRVAWSVVSVVDPLFTLPLALLVVLAVWLDRRSLALAGLAWCMLYLAFGAFQHQRARLAAVDLAQVRGHAPERLVAKPSFANQLVWKTVYGFDGRYYVDAARLGVAVSYFPGQQIDALDVKQALPWLVADDSRQRRDLERFRRFSQDYLALDPERPARVIDVRYSMVPNRVDGLWGLRLDPQHPQNPAEFFTDRRSTAEQRGAILEMLRGPGMSLSELARSPPVQKR